MPAVGMSASAGTSSDQGVNDTGSSGFDFGGFFTGAAALATAVGNQVSGNQLAVPSNTTPTIVQQQNAFSSSSLPMLLLFLFGGYFVLKNLKSIV